MVNHSIISDTPSSMHSHTCQRLCDCQRGTCVKIIGIEADDTTCRSLLSMGLTNGTTLSIHQTHRHGGPMILGLRGTQIALRSSDAAVIQVSPLMN